MLFLGPYELTRMILMKMARFEISLKGRRVGFCSHSDPKDITKGDPILRGGEGLKNPLHPSCFYFLLFAMNTNQFQIKCIYQYIKCSDNIVLYICRGQSTAPAGNQRRDPQTAR